MLRTDQQPRVDFRTFVRRRLTTVFQRFGSVPKSEYQSIVAEAVVALASQRVPYGDLFMRSLGAFPTLVKDALLRDKSSLRKIRETSFESSLSRIEPAPWENDELDPIHAQWYFDLPSVERIISCFPPGTRSLVALGTPTVAAVAAPKIEEATLIDISPRFWRNSPTWLDTSKVDRVLHDLDEKPYDGVSDADVVVMDPPWYIENYRAWLKSAVMACREGGIIIVALPQLLTNRRSLPEREEILGLLQAIGSVDIRSDELTYVTPSFEKAVLESNGLDFLRRWRHADLVIVRVRERSLPYAFQQFITAEWKYREVRGLVVRSLNEVRNESEVPDIEPVDADSSYRLAEVGRSYLWTNSANLITSHGRAAAVTKWGALPRILDLHEEGHDLDSAVTIVLDPSPERELLINTLKTILELQSSA